MTTVLNYPKALPFYRAYAYLDHRPGDFPMAHRNQSRVLSLPIYPEMDDARINYVAEQINTFSNSVAAPKEKGPAANRVLAVDS